MKAMNLVVLMNIVFLGHINCKVESEQKKGGLFYRISIEEFNKVGNELMQSPTDNTVYYGYGVGQTNGSVGRVQYQFNKVKESPSSGGIRPTMTRANITEGNRMSVETMLPGTEMTGNLVVKRIGSNEEIYSGPFRISFETMKMHYVGGKDDGPTTHIYDALHIVTLNFPECELDMKDVKLNNSFIKADSVMTIAEKQQIFKHLICDQYRLRIPLAFGKLNMDFNVLNHTLSIGTEATNLEIRSDGIYIAQTVTSTNKVGLFPMPVVPNNQPVKIPSFSGDKYPFEVAINVDTFEQIFQGMKHQIGIGARPISIVDAIGLKNRDRYEWDSNGIMMGMMFPEMGAVFPNSVAQILVTDMDFSFNISEGRMHLIIGFACNLIVTLNCDKNKTYSALNFTLNYAMPVQVGHDNVYLTINILGFGVNMTVLNSNIGHVANDQFRALMTYAADQIKQKQWDNINNKMQGLRIRDFLPSGVYENIQAIKIVKDNIVICGNLTTTNPLLQKLDRSDIVWVGQPMQDSDKYVNVEDITPIHLQAIKERNCKPEVKPQSHTSSTNTIHHGNGILLFIVSFIVSLVVHAC